jgi:hypothetical protein
MFPFPNIFLSLLKITFTLRKDGTIRNRLKLADCGRDILVDLVKKTDGFRKICHAFKERRGLKNIIADEEKHVISSVS